MHKAIFLDRDGTVTKGTHLLVNESELQTEEFAIEAIQKFNELGYKVVIVTNQPQVARGLCTEHDVRRIHDFLVKHFESQGAKIDAVYFCPHHPETHHEVPDFARKYRIHCDCRKPAPGMLLQAAAELNIDLSRSWMIGDRTVDIAAGQNAGCRTILVKTGVKGMDGKHEVEPDHVAKNLVEAADIIAKPRIKAVILAGGRGERLRPLTDSIPKPMIEIAGKPLLQHQIELLKSAGITDIIICGSYLIDRIVDYFGNGKRFGVRIEYPEELERLGSGGAIKNAAPYLQDADRFLVLNGDKMIGKFDFRRMIEFDAEKDCFATLLVRETDHPLDSDILKLDPDSRVTEFIGRGQDIHRISNSGIIISGPQLLDHIPEGQSNIEKDVMFQLVKEKDIYGFMMPKEWFVRDIGTPERLESVRAKFFGRQM